MPSPEERIHLVSYPHLYLTIVHMKMTAGNTKVVQITNIAPQATRDQMQTLFGYLGKIEDIRLYPTIRDVAVPVQSRICYVKFHDPVCVQVAQHMTNTVFIDRALIVIPFQNEIPDEQKALELTNQGTSLFPTAEPKLPPNVTNQLEGVPPNQVITTHDPKLIANGLPPYPPLSATLDSRKIEEIRRTLIVTNIEQSLGAQDLMEFFSTAGEVKYMRFGNREGDMERYLLIEFTDQTTIVPALKLNGKDVGGRPIKIYHSTQAIVKPQAKSNEAAQKEIEEAMTRVKEAQNLISAAIDPVIGLLAKEKKRSRSGSRGRRSRSLSRGRRRSRSRSRRSRSRSRRRSRNRGRSRSRRSHSRSSKHSRSRSRKRKSRTPGRRRRTRSRSRSRSRRRSRSRSRRSKSKSSKTHDKSKDKKEDKKDSKKESSKKDKEADTESKESSSNAEKETSEQSATQNSDTKDQDKDQEKDKDKDKSKSRSKEKSKEKSSREKSKSSRGRSSSRSKSRHRSPRRKSRSPRKKSRSPSRRKSPSRRRSSSRSRRKSRSPRRSHSKHSPSRKRSRSRSKSRRDSDKKKEKEKSSDDRKDKDKDRDGDRDKKKKDKKEHSEKESDSGSSSKVPRNYDEEEEGFDTNEQDKGCNSDKNNTITVEQSNAGGETDANKSVSDSACDGNSSQADGLSDEKDRTPNGKTDGEGDADDMDISTSP